ncbi:GNAT family N-acetyltransferase [candidate division KSB1 bacterium]|nr:GNAT family N-acetyltransferase [candidate division KSB1 bacterium]
MYDFEIRPITADDKTVTANILKDAWASTISVSKGKALDASELPGFIAVLGDEIIGLITYHIKNNECEIVTLDSLHEGIGVGTALVMAVKQTAINAGCTRLWLITTNDNTDAMRFYQTRGFLLVAVHRNAVTEARKKIKPEIAIYGFESIPIRDEIELEIML